jgi:hypothetical protein
MSMSDPDVPGEADEGKRELRVLEGVRPSSPMDGAAWRDNFILDELEFALAYSPADQTLWNCYDAAWQDGGSRGKEVVPSSRDFLTALKSNLRHSAILNRISDAYRDAGKKFNALLCSLASLAADPEQPDVYEEALQAFRAGVSTPPQVCWSEPVSCVVSVLIATRNRPDLLKHALASVLAQTLTDFEVLVVNDGVCNEAEQVASGFGSPRIRYFRRPPGGGQRAAFNFALPRSRAKYIAYLDDDDVYFPNHLEAVVGAAERGNLEFVCARNRWVLGTWINGTWFERRDLTKQEPFSTSRLHVSPVLQFMNLLHTRNVVERAGLYQEEPPRGGDWEFWVRASHHVPIVRIPDVTGEVRFDANTLSLALGSTLPLTNPARAAFFSRLWGSYFRSGFGHCTMAIAASTCSDRVGFDEHMQQMAGHWDYLDGRHLDMLWDLFSIGHLQLPSDLLTMLAEKHTAWFIRRLVGSLRDGATSRFRALPARMKAKVVCYPLHHPRLLANRLLKCVQKAAPR